MEADAKSIDLFTTRVRQMILQYEELRGHNAALNATIEQQKARISKLEAHVIQLQNDYKSLKVARMVEIANGDMEAAQKLLAKLIRDVDKCITLVSEGKSTE